MRYGINTFSPRTSKHYIASRLSIFFLVLDLLACLNYYFRRHVLSNFKLFNIYGHRYILPKLRAQRILDSLLEADIKQIKKTRNYLLKMPYPIKLTDVLTPLIDKGQTIKHAKIMEWPP